MILIQRQVFKELVYNFLFAFVVISVVVLLATMLKVIFQNRMLSLGMVMAGVPFMLLGIMSIVVPAASLVSVVTTYGRMAADNEILALRASGVHLSRIIVPGLLFGIVVSFFLLVANDRYVPMATKKVKTLGALQDIYPLLDNYVKRGATTLEFDEWTLTWETCEKLAKDPGVEDESGTWVFSGFRAKRYEEGEGLVQEFYAESARVVVPNRTSKEVIFQLRNAHEVVGSGFQVGEFNIPYRMPTLEGSKVRTSHRSLAALLAMLHKKHRSYKDGKILTEIHSRIAQSISPLVMIFLGLSVAVIFKYRNRMVAFFIALLIAIFVYYPIMLLGETFADSEILHPALCIWPGSAIMMGGGIWLLITVMRR